MSDNPHQTSRGDDKYTVTASHIYERAITAQKPISTQPKEKVNDSPPSATIMGCLSLALMNSSKMMAPYNVNNDFIQRTPHSIKHRMPALLTIVFIYFFMCWNYLAWN